MGLSSASRKFKTLRRRRAGLPIGTIVDHAGQASHDAGPSNGHAHDAYSRGLSTDSKDGELSGMPSPPPFSPMPSDVSGRVAMAGSATPDDIVVFRLGSWRSLISEYSSYLEAYAASQKAAQKSLEKVIAGFAMPLRIEHCFAGTEHNGVQQLGMHLKDSHRALSAQYSRIIQHIETTALDQLEALRAEVKSTVKAYTDHLGPIYRRLRKQAKEVEEYKEKLVRAIEAYRKRHRSHDAWLIQQQIRRELTKQAELENALYKAMQAEAQRLNRWEATLSERLRDIIAAVLSCEQGAHQATLGSIGSCLGFAAGFDTSVESRTFDQRFGPVLQSPLGLSGHSSLTEYDYMYRVSDETAVLLEGPLERDRGVLKKYHPTYTVLTAQGYLHCFADQKDLLEKNPDASFHLADCSVAALDDVCLFVVHVNDKMIGRTKYMFRGPDAKSTDHWIDAISSVVSKPPSPEPQIVGGTLRDSEAARAAAAAVCEAPNTLPTAAGVTMDELASRNAAQDALTQERSPTAATNNDMFFPAEENILAPAPQKAEEERAASPVSGHGETTAHASPVSNEGDMAKDVPPALPPRTPSPTTTNA